MVSTVDWDSGLSVGSMFGDELTCTIEADVFRRLGKECVRLVAWNCP